MNTHYWDQVIALQIREETFVHESSARMDSNFIKLKHGIDADKRKEWNRELTLASRKPVWPWKGWWWSLPNPRRSSTLHRISISEEGIAKTKPYSFPIPISTGNFPGKLFSFLFLSLSIFSFRAGWWLCFVSFVWDHLA